MVDKTIPMNRTLALRDNSLFEDAVDDTFTYKEELLEFAEDTNIRLSDLLANLPVLPTGGSTGFFLRTTADARSVTVTNELAVFFDLGHHFERSMCYIDTEHGARDFTTLDGRADNTFSLTYGESFIGFTTTSPAPLSLAYPTTQNYQFAVWGPKGVGINGETGESVGARFLVPTLRARDDARIPSDNPIREHPTATTVAQNPNLPQNVIVVGGTDLAFAVEQAQITADRHLASSDIGEFIFLRTGALQDFTIFPFNDGRGQIVQFPPQEASFRNYANLNSSALRRPSFNANAPYTIRMIFTGAERPAPASTPVNGDGVFNEQLYYPYFSMYRVGTTPTDFFKFIPEGWVDWRPVYTIYTDVASGERAVGRQEIPPPQSDPTQEPTFRDLFDIDNRDPFRDFDPTAPVFPDSGGGQAVGAPNIPPPAPVGGQQVAVEVTSFNPTTGLPDINPDTGRVNTVRVNPGFTPSPVWITRNDPTPTPTPTPTQPLPSFDPARSREVENQFRQNINLRNIALVDDWILRNPTGFSAAIALHGGDREAAFAGLLDRARGGQDLAGENIGSGGAVQNSVAVGVFSVLGGVARGIDSAIDFFFGSSGGGNSGENPPNGGSAGGQAGASGQAEPTQSGGATGDNGATGEQTAQESLTRYALFWNSWQLIDSQVTNIRSSVGFSSNTNKLDDVYVVELVYDPNTPDVIMRTAQFPTDEIPANYYDGLEENHPNYTGRHNVLRYNDRANPLEVRFGNMTILHIEEVSGSSQNRGDA